MIVSLIRILYNFIYLIAYRFFYSKEKRIVLVLGMHRSGTSSVAGALANVGFDPGTNLLSASIYNKKGFFEDADIVWINNEILKFNNLSWYSKSNESTIAFRKRHAYHLCRILIQKFYRSDKALLKDPRISLLLPLYDFVFAKLGWEWKAVVIKREKKSIEKSIEHRNPGLIKGSLPDLINCYYDRIYKNLNSPYLEINYESMVAGDEAAVTEVFSFLKIRRQNEHLFTKYFDKDLRHF